jgi:hypothetical protein
MRRGFNVSHGEEAKHWRLQVQELERELAMLESERGRMLVIESPCGYGSLRVHDKIKTLTAQSMIQ